jgi:glycosyltransferase involved in cell wall biosynthesis
MLYAHALVMRKYLNIDLITETYPPDINGVALTVRSLEHGLHGLGHQVGVIRPRLANETIEHFSNELVVASAPIPRYPNLRFGFPSSKSIRKRWSARRPDAIYIATEGPLGWSALRTAKQMGIPVVSGLHTRFDDYIARYGSKLLSPIALAWMRRFHNQSDITLVPTRSLVHEITRLGFTQVEQLSRAVDTVQFNPSWRDETLRLQHGIKEDDIVLLHVGRLAVEKNLELLVDSIKTAQQIQPRCKALIVGDGPQREALQEALPDAIFVGFQRGVELSRYYAIGDVFIFPSLTETFGNVTLEAMASANAVVAFNYGAAEEHIIDSINGRSIALNDRAAFIAAVLELINEPAMRKIGKAARLSMEKLSTLNVSKEFASLLEDVSRVRRIA